MLKKISAYISENNLLNKDSLVIAGVSGGADSVAMLHCLQMLNYKCIVAHCNFHLRHDACDADEAFVHKLANDARLEYHKIDFDTNTFAQQHKLSVEMAARELRYTWFEQLRTELHADVIAVAHHADDNVETLLMNLTRGSGLHGLTGIRVRNGHVIRPMLQCARNEIINYLNENNLTFVTDASNFENKYTRNKFRNEIIPLFEAINPSFRPTIYETINRLNEVETLYNEKIEQLKKELCEWHQQTLEIDIQKLKIQTSPKTILFEILVYYQFHSDTVNKIWKGIEADSGKIFYSPTHILLHDRSYLLVSPRAEASDTEIEITAESSEINFPIRLRISKLTRNNAYKIPTNKEIASFDASQLQYPLTLRRWKTGDSFIPLGMKTHKKMSDFFIDEKINRFDKENCWLLCSQNEICWVVGHRTDDNYKITNQTTNIIQIELLTTQENKKQ
ncbi:MAG: tRNA lysidine(34) synthetase TilS [Porphyromonadaceae bacterium CG2_30_38_12]|nr:MAG: tRNA lysidine(34) synthetase TilS [Porphyromonadaceae bacterium CG2_30_38_12]